MALRFYFSLYSMSVNVWISLPVCFNFLFEQCLKAANSADKEHATPMYIADLLVFIKLIRPWRVETIVELFNTQLCRDV